MSGRPLTHATDVAHHHDELHRVLALEKRLSGRGRLVDYQVTCAHQGQLISSTYTSCAWPVVHAGAEFCGYAAQLVDDAGDTLTGSILLNGSTVLASWSIAAGESSTGPTTLEGVRLGPFSVLVFTIDSWGPSAVELLVVTAYLRGTQPSSGGIDFAGDPSEE